MNKHPKYEVWEIASKFHRPTTAEALMQEVKLLLDFQTKYVVRHHYRAPDLSPDDYRRDRCMNVVAQDRLTQTIVASARLTILRNEGEMVLIGLDADCEVEWPLGVIDFVAASEPEALSPLMTELIRLAGVYTVLTLAVKQGEAPFAGAFAHENLAYSREGLMHTLPLDPSKQSNFHPREVDKRGYAVYRIGSLKPLIEDEPDAWRSSNPGSTF